MSVTTPFATVEEAIEDVREGRMVVVVDDPDRENEGDLTIAAQFATPEAINFMATHARGLICLCLTEERADELGLRPMTERNEAPLGTAFTVSIEAREGVTTGISAADRSRTIQVAIHPDSTPLDLVQPGHVFPLRARDGGVLERMGQTEAAVDLARLAGLNPSGVVCERSAAEIPVVTPSRASIETVKAVPSGASLCWVIGKSPSSSQRCSVSGRQIRPRACVAMKLIASGVANCAAMTRSPSFSRSGSSTTTTNLPWRTSSSASSTGEKGDVSGSTTVAIDPS